MAAVAVAARGRLLVARGQCAPVDAQLERLDRVRERDPVPCEELRVRVAIPQVSAIFSRETGEAGSLVAVTPCDGPWQDRHVAPVASPWPGAGVHARLVVADLLRGRTARAPRRPLLAQLRDI